MSITASENLTSDSAGSEAERNLTELTSTASEEFLLAEEEDSLEETEDESDEVWVI